MNNNLNKHAISDSELENVAGGRLYVFDASGLSSGVDKNTPYEVLDANGNNIYINGQKICFSTEGQAWAWATSKDNDVLRADWNQVCFLRGTQP